MPTQPTATPATVYQAVAACMRDVKAVGKEGFNKFHKYKFRAADDFMNAAHAAFAAHGVFIAPKVIEQRWDVRTTSSDGRQNVCILTVEYTWYGPDGSSFTTVMVGEGADSSDKAANKAMTAAMKYALMQTLMIPTQDMPDADSESPVGAADPVGIIIGRLREEAVWNDPDILNRLLGDARRHQVMDAPIPLNDGTTKHLAAIISGRIAEVGGVVAAAG